MKGDPSDPWRHNTQDITDEEIRAAIERGKIEMQDPLRPRALSVKYLPKEDRLVLALPNGADLSIPRKHMQGLTDADPSDVAKLELVADGTAIHWESIDVGHYVPALIQGYLGNDRWMAELGKRGGASRSEAKQTAARKNGRKGGRPKLLRNA